MMNILNIMKIYLKIKGGKMENVLKLNEYGSTLGLRELARQINSKLKDYIDKNETVILDFENVNSISSSFSDELIAKVMFDIGYDKYISLIKIRNANSFVKTIINSSIASRAEENKKS